MMAVRKSVAGALATVALLAMPPPAMADFHLMKVQEVYPGSTANAAAQFAELQMHAPGQNFVAGHVVRFYASSGLVTSSATFPGPVANGQNQRSILVATPAAVAQFGVTADLPIAAGLDPTGGAVCFEAIDCVSWGSFSGMLPSAAGSPEASVPDGSALCRSIARGDPNELQDSDDTNDSAGDFLPTPPAPRNNGAPAGGQPCPGDPGPGGGGGGGSGGGDDGGGGAGGGGAADDDPPETTITKHPAKTTDESAVAFGFTSDEDGSQFRCKLDKRAFRSCRSPRRYRHLDAGRHKFQVFATDRAGNADSTPAKFNFRIVK